MEPATPIDLGMGSYAQFLGQTCLSRSCSDSMYMFGRHCFSWNFVGTRVSGRHIHLLDVLRGSNSDHSDVTGLSAWAYPVPSHCCSMGTPLLIHLSSMGPSCNWSLSRFPQLHLRKRRTTFFFSVRTDSDNCNIIEEFLSTIEGGLSSAGGHLNR